MASEVKTQAEKEREQKRALYWLGERLIDYRHPVSILVIILTTLFGYYAFKLKLRRASASCCRRITRSSRSTTSTRARSAAPTTSS